jgi:putative endonuclease
MQKGKFYEEKAVEFLKLKGYKILERNFRSRWGEIDIIARDNDYIAFIEVKARSVDYLVSGMEAIDARKRKKIIKTALFYSVARQDSAFRFDVLEIIHYHDFYRYNLIKGAFSLDDPLLS